MAGIEAFQVELGQGGAHQVDLIAHRLEPRVRLRQVGQQVHLPLAQVVCAGKFRGTLMVRTSLDPLLQIAAEKSLRDGLMAYDRKLGGWRGAVTHLALPPRPNSKPVGRQR